MIELGSIGIGGDMFCLFYDVKMKKVWSLNGSGWFGKNCILEIIRKSLGVKEGEEGKIFMYSVYVVFVFGVVVGWVDMVEKFGSGKVSMEEILVLVVEFGE